MAIKASDNFKVYQNEKGPSVGTLSRKVIEKDGLYFKDIDGTGEVTKVNDWRLSAEERAAAYAEILTVEEKIGQMLLGYQWDINRKSEVDAKILRTDKERKS